MIKNKWYQQILVISFLFLALLIISAIKAEASFKIPSKPEQERIKAMICLLSPHNCKDLIKLARSESYFDTNATGMHGEIGLFQIKPSTAKSECKIYDKNLLFLPIINIMCASTYWDKIKRKTFDETFYAWNLGPNHKYDTRKLKCTNKTKSARCHLDYLKRSK